MTLAAVAPVAPAAGYTIVGLGLLVSFVVSYGLSKGWASTFGRLFQWLGHKGVDIAIRAAPDIHIHPFGFLLTIDREVQRALSQAVALSERGMTWAFTSALNLIRDVSATIEHLAERTWHGLQRVEHTATHTTTKVIRETVVKPVTKVIHATTRVVTVRVGNLEKTVRAAEARIAHATKVATSAVAGTVPAFRDLRKDLDAVRKWLRSHRYLAAYATLTALGLGILRKLKLGWLRCTKVNRAGKKLCALDPDLFDALLLSTSLVLSAVSLREMARGLEEPTALVRDGMAKLIREL